MSAQFVAAFISSGNSTAGVTEAGNNFKFTFPKSFGAGNYLLLALTYPNGATVSSISDTVNGAWSTTAQVTASNVGGNNLSLFRFVNSAAGANPVMTIVFGSTFQQPVVWELWEISGIATSAAEDGTAQTAAVVGSSLSTGSFSPTAGDFVAAFFHFADGGAAAANPTGFTAGGSFTLMEADIGWDSGQGLPKASSYLTSAPGGSINPAMTSTGDTTNHYNCVTIALKASAGAGTPPPAFYIAKFIEFYSNSHTASASWVLQAPTIGNCRVFGTTSDNTTWPITSVTDSDNNTWTNEIPGTDRPQGFFVGNQAANPNMKMTVHITGGTTGVQIHGFFWDIVGAAPSPLGAVASTAQSVAATTTVADQPDITPQSSNSIIVSMLEDGLGPVLSCTSPSGSYFDTVHYTRSGFSDPSDSEEYSSGDGQAHFYNSATTLLNWTWTILNANQNVSALAMEFKAPAVASAPIDSSRLLLGVGI